MKGAIGLCRLCERRQVSRSGKSFNRGGAKFKSQPLILVICEDTKSAKTYFEEAARYYRSSALVEFSHCGYTDPLGIVETAIARSEQFDQVICVIDRDAHALSNFNEAVTKARNHAKVEAYVSFPCFEFWLLLHFRFTRGEIVATGSTSAGDHAVKLLSAEQGMEKYAKGSVAGLFERLLPRLPDAIQRAERTLKEAAADHEPNPSTPLHHMISLLVELGKPVPCDQTSEGKIVQ